MPHSEDLAVKDGRGGHWEVTLLSDPVTSADYVAITLASILGQDRDEILPTIVDLHVQGSLVVAEGTRHECERVAGLLASAGSFVELRMTGVTP